MSGLLKYSFQYIFKTLQSFNFIYEKREILLYFKKEQNIPYTGYNDTDYWILNSGYPYTVYFDTGY